AGAMASYQRMFDAYVRIFERMGLQFRAVAADTGAIGGSASHEFQVVADTGEDAIAWCPASDYAANVELAEALAPAGPRPAPALPGGAGGGWRARAVAGGGGARGARAGGGGGRGAGGARERGGGGRGAGGRAGRAGSGRAPGCGAAGLGF